MVASQAGEQAWFQAEQRQGVGGVDSRAAAHEAAVAVQAAGQVDRHARDSLGIEAVDGGGKIAIDGARQAEAEQGIDDQVGLHVIGQTGADRHPRVLSARQRCARVGRQVRWIAQQADLNLFASSVQVQRRFEAVTAVVAGPGRDPDGLGMRCHGQ
jgi:hypothetical protein